MFEQSAVIVFASLSSLLQLTVAALVGRMTVNVVGGLST